MAIIASIVAAVTAFASSAIGSTIIGAVSAVGAFLSSGPMMALYFFGGVALACTSKNDKGMVSPSYQNMKQTQTNPDLPVPLLYGKVKVAGNRIWQDDDYTVNIKRIVAFAEGEIEEFTDIRLNDIPIEEISGITVKRYYGTDTQEVDPIIPGANHLERVKTVGSLKNVAYLAITVRRQAKIDANYNLTTIIKGRKVRVYTTRSHYTVKYSENPAWVLLDFITSYNALGLGLNNDGSRNDTLINSLIDINSFIEAAAFCDEIIDGEPRFAFNMIFDAQTSVRDLLDEIYRCCRGGLFTKNGKLVFKIDKAEPVSKIFKEDDIVKGSETFSTLPSEEHYDILKCIYISPDHEWQKVEAFAEIPEYRDGVPIEHSVNMYSCTSFKQASRLAWYYVNSKVLQPYFGSFKTDYRAYDLEVGDVIKFDSILMGVKGYRVKVTKVTDDGAGTFTVNWRTYDERLYRDELGSQEPRVLISSVSDLYKAPPEVQNFNVVQNMQMFEFAWEPLNDNNLTYEIREGQTWENASLINRSIHINTFMTPVKRRGVHRFWIAAYNGYNYSESKTLDVVNVDYIPDLNIIIQNNLLEDRDAELVNTYIAGGMLKLSPNEQWRALEEPWKSSGERYYSVCSNKWCGPTYQTGYYLSPIYDLKAVLRSQISFDEAFFPRNSSASVRYLWRYSSDNEVWSDFIDVGIDILEFRYYQVKIVLTSPEGAGAYVGKAILSIDVPDREENYTAKEITDAVQGLMITYAQDEQSKNLAPFVMSEPQVLATSTNIVSFPVVEISTPEYCVIKLYDNNSLPVVGTVNVRVRGY